MGYQTSMTTPNNNNTLHESSDAELDAIRLIREVLRPFLPTARARVLDYIVSRVDSEECDQRGPRA